MSKPVVGIIALAVVALFPAAIALDPALAPGGSSAPGSAAVAAHPKADRLASVDRGTTTGSVPLDGDILPEAQPAPLLVDIGPLKAGLDALYAGDIDDARVFRDKLPDGALDRHILSWAIAMSGNPAVTSAEISDTARRLADWPGEDTLRRHAERALYREKPDAPAVFRAFGATEPKTLQGAKLLARAWLASGDAERAHTVLAPFWRNQRLDGADETALVKEFGALLTTADHRFRMEKMLYDEQPKAALRVARLAGAEALAKAWIAMLRKDKGAAKLLDAVPPEQRSAGYLFAKAKFLRRKKDFAGAAAVMLKAPLDAVALVDPDEWWIDRRVLSRELLDKGDVKTAYRLAAAHIGEKPENVVDAEFHAGWYALRGLNDAKTAAGHFAKLRDAASGPIALARAYYWLGRAAEAGAGGDAKAYFITAARYGTAFYGQLAADRLGQQAILIDDPSPSEADRKAFAAREAVQAIARLEQTGFEARADILYIDLADALDSPGELALLAARAEQRGDHFLALRIGKVAARRGIAVGALSHPVGVIPPSAEISGAGQALAYAIARQESEFKVSAVSGANARGLLQLLPGTAKEMAKQNGLPYSLDRLTADAGYNATLGAAFLRDQLLSFDGSYVLTFVGYNAGPGRARQWMARYGDPRGKQLDSVVDWIERIPFTETRNYVQRVMENYQVYKMRLSGRFDIAADLVRGR